jgi:plastocyanin
MKRYWPFIVVVVVIVAVAAVALGNKNNKNATPPPAPTSNNSSTSASTPSQDKVAIINMKYSPADITVKKGAKVVWTNFDSVSHTVTADTGNMFDSGTLGQGKSFSFTFSSVGTFPYHCTLHPDMHGKVIVTE